MEGPRVGPGGDRPHPRRERRLGGLGRRRRPPREGRPLPPRPPQAAPEVRLRLLALRPLRPGLHPHPDRLRAEDLRGREALPQVPRRGGRPRRQLRRLDLRRARRRPVEGRAPAEDVRARAGPGLRRVQGDLRPRQQDEPPQGGRPVPAGREPPARPRLQPAAGRDALQVPRRQGELRLRDRALRRDRRVPQGRARHHVPELHGDARRRWTRPAGGRTCSSRCSRATR